MLTLVTHTRPGPRSKTINACIESIEKQLVPGVRHVVIQTEELLTARWKARELDEYIAFVDDDDIVVNNSVGLAHAAILEHAPGLIFTDQAKVNEHGEIISASAQRQIRYSHIGTHPSVAHHLAVINTSKLKNAYDLHLQFGGTAHVGALEWLMKSEAGMLGGAIHIPIIGYHWTKHLKNRSGSIDHQDFYSKNMVYVSDVLRAMRPDSMIPSWLPT